MFQQRLPPLRSHLQSNCRLAGQWCLGIQLPHCRPIRLLHSCCAAVIRQDINLTRTEASGAAIASITGIDITGWSPVHWKFVAPFFPLVILHDCESHLHSSDLKLIHLVNVGTCFSRIAMGSFVDAFGPRMGHIMILSLTSCPGMRRSPSRVSHDC